MRRNLLVAFLAAMSVAPSAAQAEIFGVSLGTEPPPSMLGPWLMVPFPLDPRPLFVTVTDVPVPLGGTLGLGGPLSHRRIGSGWATWSHGYTGDVYFDTDTTTTLTLPGGTPAFYFYAEPNSFETFVFTITALGGPTLTAMIVGQAGAQGFGFWGTGGDLITSITVTTVPGALGFAVGEFAIGFHVDPPPIPEPATLLLVGTGLVGVARRRWLQRRRKR